MVDIVFESNHHHIHMRTTRWQQSDAGCGVSECSIPAGAAAGRSWGSIFPDWQHAGVEHATPAARCAVGTPGAELWEEYSTPGRRASLTGGRRMSNTVGGRERRPLRVAETPREADEEDSTEL